MSFSLLYVERIEQNEVAHDKSAHGEVTACTRAVLMSVVFVAVLLPVLFAGTFQQAYAAQDGAVSAFEGAGVLPFSVDDDVAFAVFSDTDNSLTFYLDEAVPDSEEPYNGKAVTKVYTGFDTETYVRGADAPWYSDRKNITTVSVDESFATVQPVSLAYWFFEFSNCTDIDLAYLDTSAVEDMSHLFGYCSALDELDLSDFDTGEVTTTAYMFENCSRLVYLDVSTFDTSAVTDMSGMFSWCDSLDKLDLSDFDTSAVESMDEMFSGCRSLINLDLSGWDTSAVTSMNYMFEYCISLTELDVSGFDTSAVCEMEGMFCDCWLLESLDVSGFDTSAVENMAYLFYGCESLTSLDLSSFDTENVTSYSALLSGASALEFITIGEEFDLFAKSASTLTSIRTWYDSEGNVISEDYLRGVSVAGTYYTYYRELPTALTKDMFSVDTSSVTYTGAAIKPVVTSDLVLDVDYTVAYANNVDVGTATITIEGIGMYTGELEYRFSIERAFVRLAGEDRYSTMEVISKEAFESAYTVVLASGANFPDALAAAGLAGTLDAPIILTETDALSIEAADEIARLGAAEVVIVGGELSVSSAVADELSEAGLKVERVAGEDRYETAREVYFAGVGAWGTFRGGGTMTAIIAAGDNFPDTLSASSFAWWATAPIFLSSKNGLDVGTMLSIMGAGFDRIVIVGGENSVPASVESWARSVAPTTRLAGEDRYGTSVAFATWACEQGMSFNSAGIATGSNFPDALAGGALCGVRGSVVLLADTGSSSGEAAIELLAANKNAISRVYYLGGENSVSPALTALVENALR